MHISLQFRHRRNQTNIKQKRKAFDEVRFAADKP
jgi:hypothetical protein